MLILAAGLAVAWFMLADFRQHCFRFVEQTGGQTHKTFRTAAIEPKRAALDYILDHRTAGDTWIVTDDYWSCWPLRYLAAGQDDLHVIKADEPNEPMSRSELARVVSEGRIWYVFFSDSEALPPLRASLAQGGCKVQEEATVDYAGRPVLVLLHPTGKPPRQRGPLSPHKSGGR